LKWRLYDLRTDPTESHDLVAGQPNLAKSMAVAFAGYLDKNQVIEVPPDYNVMTQARKNAAAQN
jgi:hypothetical protein